MGMSWESGRAWTLPACPPPRRAPPVRRRRPARSFAWPPPTRRGGRWGIGRNTRHLTVGVWKSPKRPRRCDRGVELPQRPGRRIARIGKYLFAGLLLALVERGKIGMAHVELAADFADLGDVGDGEL